MPINKKSVNLKKTKNYEKKFNKLFQFLQNEYKFEWEIENS